MRVRQTLNVESGLNDGLVVPLFTVFLALAVAEEEVTATSAAVVILEEIGWGVAVGLLAVALLGTGLRWPTIWFFGWFGPCGLASIILA